MGTAIRIQASTGGGAAATIVDAAYLAALDRARDPAVVAFASAAGPVASWPSANDPLPDTRLQCAWPVAAWTSGVADTPSGENLKCRGLSVRSRL